VIPWNASNKCYKVSCEHINNLLPSSRLDRMSWSTQHVLFGCKYHHQRSQRCQVSEWPTNKCVCWRASLTPLLLSPTWLSAVHRLAARLRQIDSRSRYDNAMLFRVPICGNATADAAKWQGSVFYNWPNLTIPILFLFQTDLTALLTDITQYYIFHNYVIL
jgi:hypothetical protein